MLKDLLKKLGGPAVVEERLNPPVAMAVLQIRLALSDGDFASEEAEIMGAELSQLFDISKVDAHLALETAKPLAVAPGDHVRFTKVLKDTVDYELRGRLVESLWKIALADGHRDFEEDGFMRLIANLLGVNDRDSALARQRAQKTLS